MEKNSFLASDVHRGCGYLYTMMQCTSCYSHFADPLKEISSAWYEARYQERNYPWRWEFTKALEYLASDAPEGTYSLLDVGCGNGGFLRKLKQRHPDARLVGLDFNRWAIDELARNGVEAYAESVEQFALREVRIFDVITFFHLLEHVDDPNALLASVHKLLSEHGRIVFSIPYKERWNIAFFGYEMKDSPPHHLLRFSRAGLERILERNGFAMEVYVPEPLRFKDMWTVLGWLFSDSLRFGLARRVRGEAAPVYSAATPNNTAPRESVSVIRAMRRMLTTGLIRAKELLVPYVVLPYAVFFYAWNYRTLKEKYGHALYVTAKKAY